MDGLMGVMLACGLKIKRITTCKTYNLEHNLYFVLDCLDFNSLVPRHRVCAGFYRNQETDNIFYVIAVCPIFLFSFFVFAVIPHHVAACQRLCLCCSSTP